MFPRQYGFAAAGGRKMLPSALPLTSRGFRVSGIRSGGVMNMQRTSGLGWIRGLRRAASPAPKAVSDPAETGLASATSGCVPASAERIRSRSLTPTPVYGSSHRAVCPASGVRSLRRTRTGKRNGVLLLTVAGLLVLPAIAHADLLTATIKNQEQTVLEGDSATFTVSLAGGTGSQASVTVKYTVSAARSHRRRTMVRLTAS